MPDQRANDLTNTIYGSVPTTAGYQSILNKGYEQLNQPLNDPGTGREDRTAAFISSLAANFADSVLKKSGKLPSPDQVKQFVAQSATQGNAAKFIQGMLNDDQMSVLANQYVEGTPELTMTNQAPVTANQIGQGTNKALDQTNALYDMIQNQAVQANRNAFAPLRSRAAEEEAALGRLRSPVSAAAGSAISNIDQQEANSLQGIIGNILGQKASNTLDFTKFNETLGAGERRAAEAENQFVRNLGANNSQFNQTMNFNREKDDYERMLNNRQLSLAEMIGRQQANKKRDWLDYVNAGVGLAGTAANLYTGFGGGKKPVA